MAQAVPRKRRRRRLALAGVAWALFLLVVLPLLVRPWYRTPSAASIRVDYGRLPSNPDTRSYDPRNLPLLTHVVSVLAHRGALVRCWSPSQWERLRPWWERHPRLGPFGPWRAYTLPTPLPTVSLSPAICSELTKLAHGERPVWRDEWPDALAWSIQTLAHESMHVSGIADERRADCYGVQRAQAAAVMLGRTRAEGRYLATLYWRHWYHWHPPRIRSRECRNGGRLDLRPRSDAWP